MLGGCKLNTSSIQWCDHCGYNECWESTLVEKMWCKALFYRACFPSLRQIHAMGRTMGAATRSWHEWLNDPGISFHQGSCGAMTKAVVWDGKSVPFLFFSDLVPFRPVLLFIRPYFRPVPWSVSCLQKIYVERVKSNKMRENGIFHREKIGPEHSRLFFSIPFREIFSSVLSRSMRNRTEHLRNAVSRNSSGHDQHWNSRTWITVYGLCGAYMTALATLREGGKKRGSIKKEGKVVASNIKFCCPPERGEIELPARGRHLISRNFNWTSGQKS